MAACCLAAAGLTYAPPIMTPQSEVARPTAVTTATATAAPMAASAPAAVKEAVVKPMGPSDYSTMSLEEDEMSTEQLQCRWGGRGRPRVSGERGSTEAAVHWGRRVRGVAQHHACDSPSAVAEREGAAAPLGSSVHGPVLSNTNESCLHLTARV